MPDIDIKWIKIKTDMFDDNKIKIIRKMPEGDAIINIWVHLICLAGTCNRGGIINLSEAIYYTDEMLAVILERDLPVIRLALKTFSDLSMIEWENGKRLFVLNFEKHQNIDALEKIRALNANRNRALRARQKQLLLTVPKNNSDVTVTSRDAIDRDKIENKIREEGDKEYYINKIWIDVLEILKTKISVANYRTWFKDTKAIEITDDTLFIGVSTGFAAEYLNNNHKSLIESALCSLPDVPAHRIDFLVGNSELP